MINTNNFDQLICGQPEQAREIFSTYLNADPVSFERISDFPGTTGIYFIYKNGDQAVPIYIGSAFAENRSLKIRCGQYLQRGSGGESLRGKIEILKEISDLQAIEYIKTNFTAKFIQLPSVEENKIKQIEQIAIWAYSPRLNFILKCFNYDYTQLQKSS